ncbi:flagellar hook-associated protein FlgK [Phenylobacterium deserti]|uniref:Flagellar hook-associated protein 1 n=1 Tax=Phenylobacterium deserti TaxID=1914756 RepID=A0A328AB89_9CAUL|nr:flagellar hook-associated protein FlgK [Phenylobacterium deserti]RAK51486.1 flagellar hook-associated protein FlgK [Phenylobacterium deserti]
MSLTATLKTANSGLMAAQTGLRAVSDNIANVNTPGYVRKTVNQRPVVVNGSGMGVEVTGLSRVTDQYLQLATLAAGSEASRWDVVSKYLDNAQSLFGDPSSDTFFFSRLDDIYSAFSAASNDPASSLRRGQALNNVQDMLAEAKRINGQLTQIAGTLDSQIKSDIARANDLLKEINRLNGDITRAKLVDQDASGSENIQAQLVDELATMIDIKVSGRSQGGIEIRSAEGVKLSGDGAATLNYVRNDGARGYISVTSASGVSTQPILIKSGAVRGLLDLRDVQLPAISDQLGEFMTRATDQLNAAHNAASAVPAPASLTGRDTGLDIDTAVGGFTGKTTVAIVNAAGVLQRRVDIDFDNGTMSVDGGPATGFSPASFLSTLDGALGGMGTATFSAGALSISASGGNGVAIDEGTSMKAGRAFSHFFGLNDLIRSDGITNFDTGLTLGDAHGFNGGDQITLRLAQPDGKPISDVTVTIPSGGTMADLLNELNSSSTGVGLYGQFNLDAVGALNFSSGPPLNANVSVLRDDTQRGASGPAMSQLFGIGAAVRSARANNFSLDPAIAANSAKLALAKLNLNVAAGAPALTPGDGDGARLLAASGDVITQFQSAGVLAGGKMSVSRYASEMGGAIGREAAAAETRAGSANAVKTEANNRRQSVEGVNLDEELVRLTTYQQAFNASARMIQAAKELFDVLTNTV